MTQADLHMLAVMDLHARVRLGLWALLEEKPERLHVLGEAASLAVADCQQEAARRGYSSPVGMDQTANLTTAGPSRACGVDQPGEAAFDFDTPDGAAACGGHCRRAAEVTRQ